MFLKNMKLAYLLDFYSEVLDEHTRAIMSAYYSDDLSLAALLHDVTKEKKGEEQLEFLEERLALAARHDALSRSADLLRRVRDAITDSGVSELQEYSADIDEVIDVMINRGV